MEPPGPSETRTGRPEAGGGGTAGQVGKAEPPTTVPASRALVPADRRRPSCKRAGRAAPSSLSSCARSAGQ
eukprot:4751800-Alexandrium_andersonii.AAC.1